ncbi:MAG: hypothetical protein U0289_09050 [Cyclobacteriaceae bacterium]|nr:hypothetical protein [Cyclobacteriaceae bacterium]
MQSLLKGNAPQTKEVEVTAAVLNKPVKKEDLITIWNAYAESRKDQVAEYQFLKRDIDFQYPNIQISISNPVEEHLLDNFRRDFTQYLRDQLQNSNLTIVTVMQDVSGQKVIYTAKDKFDHLAAKNPHIITLKERLGLDWDF